MEEKKTIDRIGLLRNLAVCIVGGSIMTFFTCRHCRTDLHDYLFVDLFTVICWMLLWLGNSLLSHYLSRKISWIKFPIRRFVIGFIITIAYTASSVILLMYSFEYFFNFDFGDGFTWSLYFSIIITIIISLFLHSREFLMSWKQAAIDKERLERENIQARFESLKNQVNPHFLFNSFNALTNLVYEDQDKAAKFIKQLSEVYRYVLDSRDHELVPLEEDLRFLQSYLYLEQIRFGEKLRVSLTLNGTQSLVAPLALQMLVENAIKHNIISEAKPLSVSIFREGDFIVVSNKLQRKTVQETSVGIGLENIRHRYAFLSNTKVEVIETDDSFTVKLPIIISSQL